MPETLRRLLHNAPTLLGVVLILLISLSFATQTIDWLELNRSQAPVQSSESGDLNNEPALDSIQTLFGPARVVQDSAPPATNLSLTLRGSFVHNDANRSSAIIQREGNRPQRFAIGSEIDKGIRLHAVYRDRVEIERSGRLETLMFNKHKSASRSNQASYDAAVDDLSTLQQQDEQQIRERMEALRQQMENAGGQVEPEPEPPYEAEPPAAPQSTELIPIEPPTESD
ncbi:type II secretion system protein N [Pseudomonas turukhanskensis]|uniref:type II secretion system protein N n=1 Tax=Pseudomonas turukhanskensis TaxID=1806536 RepID=UPI0022F2A96D|nr:type II secretion system protein N [Pseudomonas turukhanskensis]